MKTIHILLVEDNEGDILLTREAFESSKVNNKLSVVRDGQEAMNFLNKQGDYSMETMPDLLLLDINLPKRSGIEVLKFIKEEDHLKHIPVIMLSTSSSEEDIKISYQNQANCYITKPVNIERLSNIFTSIQNFWFSVVNLPLRTNSE